MVTEALCNVGFWLLNGILDMLDVLPDIPGSVVVVLDEFFDLIFVNGWRCACWAFPMRFALTLLPLVILAVNFEEVYHVIMWVLRKIPFIGVE